MAVTAHADEAVQFAHYASHYHRKLEWNFVKTSHVDTLICKKVIKRKVYIFVNLEENLSPCVIRSKWE